MITGNEIRERYLEFFRKRGHRVCPSDSLIPSNDPSLLFTGAGMNQFKDMFLGRGAADFKRATTSQKCLRTGDLERVGKTSGHHTFFEMLGNFSFGDYFKREAISWAWEFVNQEMNIPASRLHVSVYTEDDEAYDIWNDEVGVPEDHIVRLGEEDNFWPASAPSQGPNGPCGPCSEIYFDFGADHGCGAPTCGVGCHCNRYVEIWNLVFTQFDRQDDGSLPPLPQKNIDTGAGLERFAAVLQGVTTNFDTDLFQPIIQAASELLKHPYKPGHEDASRLRRIADHVRALCFCIADNALPGNTGRNYVVRRILRTAVRDGVALGSRDAFLHKLVPVVIDGMKKPYPYLGERRKTLEQVIKTEEDKFLDTLEKGTALISELIKQIRQAGKDMISGEEAFKLYDTFGFPIEMTEEFARPHGIKVDLKRFRELVDGGRDKAEMFSDDIFGKGAFADIKAAKVPATEFLGYGIAMADLEKPHDATVLRIIRIEGRKEYDGSKKEIKDFTRMLNGSTLVDAAGEGTDVAVLLDRTPFYGESGGQVGDAGTLSGDATVEIEDCKRPDDYFLHLGRVTRGTLKVGAKVKAAIDAPRRRDIMRNHTGTHLLQSALRAVLGDHVEQKGSVVHPDRLRFDFIHFQAVTPEELRRIEDWVNDVVFRDPGVTKSEMSMEEAKKKGAIAFFGDKYGDRVRVVTVGDGLSVELCGGTHLEHASTIGGIRIVSESSVGSGVRRIEAVTGPGCVAVAREQEDALLELSKTLKSPKGDVVKRVKKLQEELSKLKSRAGAAPAPLDFKPREIGGETVVIQRVPEAGVGDLRKTMDGLIKKKKVGAAILAGGGEKPTFVIGVRPDLVKARGLKAGDLAKEIGRACGGGGGGRELQAQAGAGDPSKVDLGFETFETRVREKLGG